MNNKACLALAVIAAIDHCFQATRAVADRAAADPNAEVVEYVPLAFLPTWVFDGGRNGSLKAFNAEALQPYEAYITYTPSRRDDDRPTIQYCKKLLQRGEECYLLTNDNYRDHIQSGDITQAWFDAHVLSYMWVGRTNNLLINNQQNISLPELA